MKVYGILNTGVKVFSLVLLLASSGFWPNAFAQEYDDIPQVADPKPDKDATFGKASRMVTDEGGRSLNVIEAFDGWSSMLRGYQKTPILIDPKPEMLQRVYPELQRGQDNTKRDSLANAYRNPANRAPAYGEKAQPQCCNVTVDDEVFKTRWAIYQPLLGLKNDHLMDVRADQEYLQSLTSRRANTNFTLAGLDKTIMAVLTATEQQANEFVSAEIQKQISWSASKIANPHREQIYTDVDETVEYCLAQYSYGGAPGDTHVPHESRIKFECDTDICGPVPRDYPQRYGTIAGNAGLRSGNYPGQGKGLFRWCVCCAERHAAQNKSTRSNADEEYSLVDKIFGLRSEFNMSASTPQQKVKTVAALFKDMYGDIQIVAEDGNFEPGTFTYRFVFPEYSVPEKITAIRDSCWCEGNLCNGLRADGGGSAHFFCPMTGGFVKYGICPAIQIIMHCWEQIIDPNQPLSGCTLPRPHTGPLTEDILKQLWIEASLGTTLTADDVGNWIEMQTGNRHVSIPYNEVRGELFKSLDAWCDASGVAAFRSFHARYKSIVMDHLTLNTRATFNDKQRLISLMDRVSAQLGLGEMDTKGNYMAQMILEESSRKSDRNTQKYVASTAQANRAQLDFNSQSAGNTVFGGMTTTVNDMPD